jgi:TetR/AcrR family transcriptional regulator, fatty acid metabolism regulator protein
VGTKRHASEPAAGTFLQVKRRDQLVDCAIEAIAELGFARASVAEVARRAGVSKGVVTYHFPAKDDLISAVIADIVGSLTEFLTPRYKAADPTQFPERWTAAYITAWVDCYRAYAQQLLALVRVHDSVLDEAGRPGAAHDSRAVDIALVTRILEHGQSRGTLGTFDARVIATVMKAALDGLLREFTDNPALDLEAYAAQLISLFERATRPDPAPGPPSPPA